MRYEPIKIRLEEPRTFDGKELTHISMRQPTANDVILSQHAVASIGAQGVRMLSKKRIYLPTLRILPVRSLEA